MGLTIDREGGRVTPIQVIRKLVVQILDELIAPHP